MTVGPDPFLGHRFSDALAFATEQHETQVRKGTSVPYLSHLMAVSSLVLEDGGSEDEAIAALLHDVIEDQPVTADEITERFGKRVAKIVVGCSAEEKDGRSWKERKDAYIAHMRGADASTMRVSLADKLHNARCILRDCRESGGTFWTRFNASPEDILWYYRSLLQVYVERANGPMARELARVVTDLEGVMLAQLESR